MDTKMIFTGVAPTRFELNGITFDLDDAVKDSVLSEQCGDLFIIHRLYAQQGNQWQDHRCMVSSHPNGETTVWVFDNTNLMMDMFQYCAVIYIMENKYRQPLSERFAEAYPTVEEVYGYNPEEFKNFENRYFLGQVF